MVINLSKEDVIEKLKKLINENRDQEAYILFHDYYFQQPLVLHNGDDTKLAEVANVVGFDILHKNREWQREVDWWQSVINTLEEYDKENTVNLHKGLPNHNIVLPLLELNRPKTAVDYLKKAIQEDQNNFGEEEVKRRPAYKLSCFLIPIVMTGHWKDNDSRISQDEIRRLIDSFEVIFKLTSDINQFSSTQQALQGIDDEDLKETLFKRYRSIEKNLEEDAVIVAIYAGSIVEGILTILLKRDYERTIQEFRQLARQKPSFIYYLHSKTCDVITEIINQKAPEITNEEIKRKAIDNWEFGQKIEIAQKLGLFGQPEKTALFILCHLLREYRNIVHPSNKDTLGLSKEWEITFKLEPQIAKMLKGALDVVLSLLQSQDLSKYHIAGKLSEAVSKPNYPPVTASGIKPHLPLTSLASTGRQGKLDYNNIPIYHSTETTTNTKTSSNPTMGSTSTTTTTLPDMENPK